MIAIYIFIVNFLWGLSLELGEGELYEDGSIYLSGNKIRFVIFNQFLKISLDHKMLIKVFLFI